MTFFVFLFILGGLNYSLAGVNYLGSDELLDIDGTPSRNTETAGIAWKNNGSKLFVMGTGALGNDDDELLEYSCSTNFDVSTCTYDRELPLNNDHSGPNGPIDDKHPFGFTFNGDGSSVYVSGNETNKIYEIKLDTEFDLSSASYTTEIASIDGTPCGITFNNDGTKLFLAGFAQHRIVVWTLDTPYRLASVASSIQFSVSAQSQRPRDIDFNSDGTKMYVVSGEDKYISVYSLMNAFDLSDGERVSHLGNFLVSEQDNQPFSIEFNNDGSKFYMNGYQNDSVYEYNVSTAFELINTAPTLTSSTPADDAPGVAIDANIVLNFSENVNAVSGNITIKKTSDNSTVETISVTSGQVTGSGSTEITVNPTSNFDNNTQYYVLIDDTSFDDVDGGSDGSYAGISSTTDLSFTVANTLPTLSSSVPANNAIDVERDADIVLNFSENVNAVSGNITIKKTSDNSTVETISVTSGQVTGSGSTEITVNPTSNFDNNTQYYVLIDDTSFDNSSSGSYAGISSTTALSFTVKAMIDPRTDKNVTGSIEAQNLMAQSTFGEFISLVNDRLRYLRQNRTNEDFTKNNIKLDFENAMLSSLVEAVPSSKIPSPNLIPDNWSSWSEGSIGMTKIGDSKNSSSKDIDTQGLALGLDTKLDNNDLLGLALQFSQSDTDVGTEGTGIDSKNYNLSVYRTRPLNDNNFVEGLFGVVLTENELVRKSGTNTLTGSRNGTQIFGSINYGKTLDKENFNLTPIVRVDLGYTELDSYTETGTDALTYGKQTIENGLASVGLEINNIVKFSNSSLKPFGSFQYGLDFSNSSDTKLNYASDTSTIYVYTPGINSAHLLTTEIGFNYELKDHLKLMGTLKRIQGSESLQTNNMRFGFHYITQRETEYAMSLDGSDELMAGFDISKNMNGFDIKLGSNYNLINPTTDYGANLEISKIF